MTFLFFVEHLQNAVAVGLGAQESLFIAFLNRGFEGVLFEVVELAYGDAAGGAGLREQSADVVDIVLPDLEAALYGAEGHLRRRLMVDAKQQRRFDDPLEEGVNGRGAGK